jgi:homoserine O-acetyltransferase
MIGPGRPIDTRRFFVICVNSLGSCFGSTGPASIDPTTGRAYQLTFPELSVEDIARAGYVAARSLGIEILHAVVGPSLGGMVVLAFAAVLPGRTHHLVTISGSAAASPFTLALRSLQREAILRDPEWKSGQYAPSAPPRTGLRLARKLGTITYRSTFAVEGYLEAQAERFVASFDANCYLYLSRAMDRFDLSAHGASMVEIFGRAGLSSALVIGVESDLLFPIGEQRALADAFLEAGVPTDFVSMPSIEGHDAFLVDLPRFGAAMGAFLGRT